MEQHSSVTKEAAVKSSNWSAAPPKPVQEFATHHTPFQLLQRLHATAGNRAAGQWIQAKLKVGAPNDIYEQEADRVADQIISASNNPAPAQRPFDLTGRTASSHLQRQSLADDSASVYDEEAGEPPAPIMPAQESEDLGLQMKPVGEESAQGQSPSEEDENYLQRKPAFSSPAVSDAPSGVVQRQCACGRDMESSSDECAECKKEHEGSLQRAAASTDRVDAAPPIVDHVLRSSGQPLDNSTRAFFEPRFGFNLDSVRVHADAQAARSADAVRARAYTVGSDIVFAENQLSVSSDEGRRLLAHELAHVVQQGAAPRSGAGRSVAPSAGDSLRRVSRRVQRAGASCLKLLHEPGSSNPALGLAVQAEILLHFRRRVGKPATVTIPDASAKPLRTEGRRYQIDPQEFSLFAGPGHPDLAYKRRGSPVMLLAEIKPANVYGLSFAELQLVNYLDKGNANPDLKARLGVRVFAPMTELTYRPPAFLNVGQKRIRVMWCGPGVIVYKAVEHKKEEKKKKGKEKEEKKKKGKKEDEEEKKKEGKAGGNVGFGIGILSSGGGKSNAVLGVAINSHGTAYGTVSAGIVYDSNGNAVASASAGAGAHVSGNIAGAVAAGAAKDTSADAALSATAGKGEDTSAEALASASAGTAKGTSSVSVATASHGHGEDTDTTTIAKAGKAGGSETGGAEKTGAPGGVPGAGLQIPGKSPAETQKAVEEAAKIDGMLQKATPAQKELLAYLAQTTGDFEYQVSGPEWVQTFMTATAGLSEEDIAYLQKLHWVPGKESAAELRKKIEAQLKKRGQAKAPEEAKGAEKQTDKPQDVGDAKDAEKKLSAASLDKSDVDPKKAETDEDAFNRLYKRAKEFNWAKMRVVGQIVWSKEGRVYNKPSGGPFYFSAVINGKHVRVTADVGGILRKEGDHDVFEIRSCSIVVTSDKRAGPGSMLVGVKIRLKR
jgi:hypothetical protein